MKYLFVLITIAMFGCTKKTPHGVDPVFFFVEKQGVVAKREVSFSGMAPQMVKKVVLTSDENCTIIIKKYSPKQLSRGSYVPLVVGTNSIYLLTYYKNGTKKCFNDQPLAVFEYVPSLRVQVESLGQKIKIKNLTMNIEKECQSKCSVRVRRLDKLQIENLNKVKGTWSQSCNTVISGKCNLTVLAPTLVKFNK